MILCGLREIWALKSMGYWLNVGLFWAKKDSEYSMYLWYLWKLGNEWFCFWPLFNKRALGKWVLVAGTWSCTLELIREVDFTPKALIFQVCWTFWSCGVLIGDYWVFIQEALAFQGSGVLELWSSENRELGFHQNLQFSIGKEDLGFIEFLLFQKQLPKFQK